MRRSSLLRAAAALGVGLLPTLRALAQTAGAYPGKPIRLVVPYPPGGGADLVARVLAKSMAKQLGQPIVVDNRTGANGNIGLEVVAKSPPDGYTLLIGTAATHSINPALYATLPFDAVKDFSPIGLLATGPHLLVYSPAKFTAQAYSEFLVQAKAQSSLSYASSGSGSTAHLAAEMWRGEVGIAATHVPYRGTGPALLDVVSGQVDIMFCPIASALPFVQGGKLRAVLVTSAARIPSVPTVPTGKELGLPDLIAELWYAMYGPAHLSPDIVKSVGAALGKALADPEVLQVLASQALVALPSDAPALVAQQRADLARWSKVVKATGATAN